MVLDISARRQCAGVVAELAGHKHIRAILTTIAQPSREHDQLTGVATLDKAVATQSGPNAFGLETLRLVSWAFGPGWSCIARCEENRASSDSTSSVVA